MTLMGPFLKELCNNNVEELEKHQGIDTLKLKFQNLIWFKPIPKLSLPTEN
jgi:hypothetical protein